MVLHMPQACKPMELTQPEKKNRMTTHSEQTTGSSTFLNPRPHMLSEAHTKLLSLTPLPAATCTVLRLLKIVEGGH